MVKLTFNSALGQKDLKKEEKDEALIPQDVVSFVSTNANRLVKLKTTLITALLLAIQFFIKCLFVVTVVGQSV